MELVAYKNDASLKKRVVAEIERHRKMDAIEQGTYGRENGQWRGCAVSCTLRSLAILDKEELHTKYEDHALYETKLGIPEWLARLEDTIFEGLPVEEARKWPGLFAEAINVGANLEPVKWKFCAFILKENIKQILKLNIKDNMKKKVIKAIQGVLFLHEKALVTGVWDESAAWSAVRSAESAARSAESAVRSAESARSAAWSAAWSAARSAAESARSAAYQAYAKELLRILKETK